MIFRLFLAFALCFVAPGLARAQMLTGYDDPEVQVEPVELPPEEDLIPVSEPIQERVPEPIQQIVQKPLPQVEPVAQPAPSGWVPFMTTSSEEPVPQITAVGEAAAPQNVSEEEAVDLQADDLVHDQESQIIIASGDVFLTQAGRILRADEIIYDLKKDTAKAQGHVVLSEVNGDIHYSEEVEFNDKLKDGFVKGLQSYLADGSRFTAVKGKRKDGSKTIMEDASYTPCEPCKANPEKAPAWQIVAAKVKHDEEAHRISYNHARFEVHGVPVAYVPYFAHADGTVDRKSGFLAPRAGFKSGLGTFGEASYYLNIAPDKDATVGMMAMTEQDPLFFGEWRQRWNAAKLEMQGGITNSSRTERSGGIQVKEEAETRGHLLGSGVWDINDKWRSGVNVAWASDDQYMRQYDFTNEDVLENEIYAERFSGRNYAAGRLLSFQDIRVRDEVQDQPNVLPEIVTSFVGEPGQMPLLKGRWNIDGSVLGLQRSGSDQDMTRLSLNAGWERRLVSDYGLLTRVESNMRGDAYHTSDRDIATPGSGRSRESSHARFYPNLHVQSSYPLVNNFERMQAVIEPIVSMTVAPNIDVSGDIPNEDSQDVQIDASNLFEANRFPGLDRVEDQSRITYGVRTGLYGYGGSRGDIFLGQSFRLSEDDNPFPEGSGLDEQSSDVVGQISAFRDNSYSLDYRFQLATDNFSSQRHEVDASKTIGTKFTLGTRYLFAKGLEGTGIDESREQLQASASYAFTDSWAMRVGATQDLGQDPGLRRGHMGLDYTGQCYSWSVTGERNYTDDSSGDSDTEIIFRIGLKNLGEFEGPGVSLGSENE